MEFKNFDAFLNEKQGVPMSIIEVANQVAKSLRSELKNLYKPFETTTIINFNTSNVEFPVKAVQVVYEHTVKKDIERPIVCTGGMAQTSLEIADDLSFTFEMFFSTFVDSNYKNTPEQDRIEQKYVLELTSCIFHEMLHAYETYNRELKKQLPMSFATSYIFADTAVKINQQNDTKKDLEFLNQFIFLIYASSAFECNARTTQTYALIKDVEDIKDREAILKASFAWNIAKTLQEFSAERFTEKLIEFAKKRKSTNIDYDIKMLTKSLANSFIKNGDSITRGNINIFKFAHMLAPESEYIELAKKASSAVNSSTNTIMNLSRKDPKNFFKYWEKKFNYEGKRAINKLSKLLTL